MCQCLTFDIRQIMTTSQEHYYTFKKECMALTGVCSLRWTVSASAFQPHCRPYGSPPALGGADAAVALAGAAAAWPACVPPPFPLGGSSCGSSPSSLMACRKSRHKSSDGSPCSRTPTSGSGAAAISGDILRERRDRARHDLEIPQPQQGVWIRTRPRLRELPT